MFIVATDPPAWSVLICVPFSFSFSVAFFEYEGVGLAGSLCEPHPAIAIARTTHRIIALRIFITTVQSDLISSIGSCSRLNGILTYYVLNINTLAAYRVLHINILYNAVSG